tara:strand:+ start:381 stop:1064 length:684 start_codon:yes stop_codon:yes gene_type:complete
MPISGTIYSNTNDGYVALFNQSTWADAKGTTGNSAASNTSGHVYGASAYRASARGGGYTYSVYRSFFYFNTSLITKDVVSATLKLYGYSNGGGDLIVVKSNSDIETLGTADFDSIVGWDGVGMNGSGGGDNESNVTKYSTNFDEIGTWSTSGYNDIPLNAQALVDMRNDDTFYICVLNYDYDLKDEEPEGDSAHKNGFYYQNYSGTSRDPKIEFTYKAHATFFGTNF